MLQAYCASGCDGLKVSTVRKLQGSYAALWEAAQYMDKKLCAALFCWYVDTVLNIVVSVRAVYHTLSHYNAYSASGAYVHAAYLAVAFLLVSLSAANLVAQRRHLLQDMCRLVCTVGGAEDDELCNQVSNVRLPIRPSVRHLYTPLQLYQILQSIPSSSHHRDHATACHRGHHCIIVKQSSSRIRCLTVVAMSSCPLS
nr:uncharacterized protein LOC126527472 isoform X1 [Dermacentor andersoni]